MKSGQPATFEMVLDHDFGWDDGLICGGSVSGIDFAARGGSGGTLAPTRRRHRTGSLGREKGFSSRSRARCANIADGVRT